MVAPKEKRAHGQAVHGALVSIKRSPACTTAQPDARASPISRKKRPSAARRRRLRRSTRGSFWASGRGLRRASTTLTAERARALSHSARQRIRRTNNQPERSAAAREMNSGTLYFLKMRLKRAHRVYPRARRTMPEIRRTRIKVPTPMPGPIYRKERTMDQKNVNHKDTPD